ncbi:HDIG domain-containing metalloprotein [Maridesulfovibrio sp.]|uniref:HDIG domain-containing metalloprotein n=1 Tax=Maridesulfovibrio sp. TaxID=2795000 RepID=UPI002A18C8EC|nr:HDIG domain-containing metalloprotein [Maridesulfovibrio sp.]
MISRDEAFELLKANVPEENLIQHSLESEAVLGALARKLGQDEELWSITGLLHDLDYSSTASQPEKHGLVSAEMLDGKLPDEAVQAIRAHNGEMTGVAPQTDFDFALRCGETVTGLIHANALMRPEKMSGMTPKSLKKKMKSKAFAASVNRDIIKECDRIGLELGDFFAIAIDAVTGIAPEVGLD